MKSYFRIASEGYPIFLPLAGMGLAVFWKWPLIGTSFLLASAAVAWFFRDPERAVPDGENLVLSPADGRIVAIEPVRRGAENFLRISIYLSLWDVHITRAPLEGRVRNIQYTPGSFFSAFREKARRLNENNLIDLSAAREQKVAVRQIAGAVARKIVCYCQPGQVIRKGERIGMIKFGSCVQMEIPENAKMKAVTGQKVRGGETVLAELE